MRNISALVFMATVLSLGTATFASGTMSAMMKPSCKAGDAVVGVNMQNKMYMTHDQMKAKMAGMSKDQMHAAMQKNHVKLMCKSQADAMGAKMMSAHK